MLFSNIWLQIIFYVYGYVKLAIDKLCFRVLFIKRYHHHTQHNNMNLHVHKYFELFLSNTTIPVTINVNLLPHKSITPDMYVLLPFVKYRDKETKHLGRPLEQPVLWYVQLSTV